MRRLRQAGAVVIGKTNMVEFALSGVGLNPHFGTPGNATDPERIPGGSSSGAGVSVAEGTSDISIGSDTGGSVRIPAALNGVVGFKPTAKRVPLDGVFPVSCSLDSIGPLARPVQDCAFADAIMAGEETRWLTPRSLAGLRIGIPQGRLLSDLERMVAETFDVSLRCLERAGARIIAHDIEDLLGGIADATAPASIALIEAAAVHADWLESKAAQFDPRIHRRVALGGKVSASVYMRMMRRRAELSAQMDERLRPIDVLALPTTAMTAPRIQDLLTDDQLYTRANRLVLRNTTIANQFDLTSISLPIRGYARPSGLMLFARRATDHNLLEIAAGVEQELARSHVGGRPDRMSSHDEGSTLGEPQLESSSQCGRLVPSLATPSHAW